jgi:NADH dehydrogenase FAD-containing subunit
MRAKVVVLGAGYAGLPAAKRLARQVHAEEVGVTLVNARAEFVERPRLHQLATGQPVAVPQLAAFLAGTAVKLQLGTVTGIDVDGNTVTVQTGRGAQVIGYDTLVYALGSNIDICAVPGVAEHAWSLTDREAAVRLGCRLGELAKVSA